MAESTSFDVIIVGGGAIGAAIAYFLKAVEKFPGSVALIERDPTFRTAATALSCSSIRQQFSTAENIRLSRFGLEFLRLMPDRFGVDADPVLHERGYLILASAGRAKLLQENHAVQRAEEARVALLDAAALQARFPWLATDGIEGGSLGLAGEGWFDANTLLRTLRSAARTAGALLLTEEVTGLGTDKGLVESVRLSGGGSLTAGSVVNAAGPSAGRLAAMAGRELPVEPRKRTVFVVDCPDAPRDMPLVADPSGVYVRPEGSGFITGYSPPPSADGPADPGDFLPDHDLFEEVLWPLLARRIPAFATLKVSGAWAGHYDYNVLDQNAVIGRDPVLRNFIYANGFSGHGLQHAPGVGRAMAELIVHGGFRTIDLSVFGYDRIPANRPHFEREVI